MPQLPTLSRSDLAALLTTGLLAVDAPSGSEVIVLGATSADAARSALKRLDLRLEYVFTDMSGRETALWGHVHQRQLSAGRWHVDRWNDIADSVVSELERRANVSAANRRRRGRPAGTVRLPNVEGGWRETLALVLRLIDGDESVRSALAARLEVLR